MTMLSFAAAFLLTPQSIAATGDCDLEIDGLYVLSATANTANVKVKVKNKGSTYCNGAWLDAYDDVYYLAMAAYGEQYVYVPALPGGYHVDVELTLDENVDWTLVLDIDDQAGQTTRLNDYGVVDISDMLSCPDIYCYEVYPPECLPPVLVEEARRNNIAIDEDGCYDPAQQCLVYDPCS